MLVVPPYFMYFHTPQTYNACTACFSTVISKSLLPDYLLPVSSLILTNHQLSKDPTEILLLFFVFIYDYTQKYNEFQPIYQLSLENIRKLLFQIVSQSILIIVFFCNFIRNCFGILTTIDHTNAQPTNSNHFIIIGSISKSSNIC